MSVLLTGSSQGIGRATAELFLSKGYKVWGLDVLPASVVHENYTHIVCDVSDVNTLPDISGIEYVIFDDVKPNPTCENVNNGLEMLKKEKCDCIISVGGGSPQDTASGISILAANGGEMKDYEGVNKSEKTGFPVIAVNTTAGTSAELTINYVITDEERHVKMICIDKNSLAKMSVNDPELMDFILPDTPKGTIIFCSTTDVS